MRILIDIGHARGTGARGNGEEEHDLCARYAPHLQAALTAHGISSEVIDYPDKNNRDDLNATIRAANSASGFDFGVSLHMDCSDNAAAHGAHVCYLTDKGLRIATPVAKALAQLMPGRASLTVQRPDLAVLKRTTIPWILIEHGFISHAHDMALMRDNPETVAETVAAALATLQR